MIWLILSFSKNSFNGNTTLFLRLFNDVTVGKLVKKETRKRKYDKIIIELIKPFRVAAVAA